MWLTLLPLLPIVAIAQNKFDGGPYFTTPDTFPSPNTTGAGGWEAALAQANAFLAQLNLTEKVYMVTGASTAPCTGNIQAIPRLNFSGLCLMDGPAAIRQADLASVFPSGVTTAATWDKDLIYQRGVALAEEFKGKGSHVILGPVCGPLGRHALGGRNWEGFSPDPYLTGIAVSASIKGIQSTRVQACVKHFIGNEQETHRSTTTAPDGSVVDAMVSNIDDRTMHEMYMWPFADSIKAGVASVMCSYNRINQTYGCENSKALNGLLKEELGFQGYVVSDWYATHASRETALGGMDMDMPGNFPNGPTELPRPSHWGLNLTALVGNGTIPESRLDDMVRRVMTPYFYLRQDQDYPSVDPSSGDLYNAGQNVYQFPLHQARDVQSNHATLIRQIASAGTVLLKNVNSTLPLKKPANLAVFGNDAPDITAGLVGNTGDPANTTIGTLIIGGGSGTGRSTYIVPPIDALKARTAADGTRIQYVTDNSILATGNIGYLYPYPDVCLIFLKSYAGEGADRTLFPLDGNSTLVVEQVAGVCNNTVVITHSVGINTMPWSEHPNVTAIIAAHLPGQESGNSIVDVLYGAVNPSGKLPYTIARNESDYNTPILNLTGTDDEYDADKWQEDFSEGLFTDYRHFDAEGISPLFEFGFGLSYTTFAVSNLSMGTVSSVSSTPPRQNQTSVPGGNPALWQTVLAPSVIVQNDGDVAGATVLQLYVSLPGPPGTPVRVLRGFEKVTLSPGESRNVSMPLRRRDVSYWDVEAQEWMISQGDITISVGLSSRDLRVNGTVVLVEGENGS